MKGSVIKEPAGEASPGNGVLAKRRSFELPKSKEPQKGYFTISARLE